MGLDFNPATGREQSRIVIAFGYFVHLCLMPVIIVVELCIEVILLFYKPRK